MRRRWPKAGYALVDTAPPGAVSRAGDGERADPPRRLRPARTGRARPDRPTARAAPGTGHQP
ncbi:hypothetical protein KCH_00330 [Kitasatospora cheerisanensis KCTC 2395]|uniref:Uncharacterized protein n=1 Tax=Kitasatospora cheerisanensis KCTC 2395 TaxID=1348663 RepID=A0A066Z364_9ACTN|nr:hypothetical protein KCH_00330 [Kitasatospora cheerisanensis KCTC 2395]